MTKVDGMAGLEEQISSMKNLVDLLRYRSEAQALETAFIFLPEGEREEIAITYRALDEKARAIASTLQAMNASGERVVLLYPPGLDFITAFLGCLYAGAIAVPAYPPRNNHHNHRLQAIVEDAGAKTALTTTLVFSNLEKKINAEPALAKLSYVSTDEIDSNNASTWQPQAIDGDALAFLQYTSGSTGKPKGVMVSHQNLMYNEKMIQQAFGHTSKTIVVGWLPVYHDMGLIGNLLQPLYLGRPCIFMPPVAFLRQPIRWLQAISRYRATTSGAPNFAYELCAQKIKPEQLEGLDLSSWEVAFTGAEPVRDRTMNRFAETFSSCGFKKEAFYPCYGMAETTLLVSGGLKTEPANVCFVDEAELLQNKVRFVEKTSKKAKAIVSCGCSWLEQTIAIVNPETCRPCNDGEVGEIWVRGENVAQGYWQKTDLNQQAFNASMSGMEDNGYLRTGDLGFVQDSELFVTGRLKDVVIIRGQNHYPQDIELTVDNSHEALISNSSAAFSVDIEGEEKLVVMAEVERRYHREIRKYKERRKSLASEDSALTAPPIFQEVIRKVKENIAQNHGLDVHAVLLLRIGTLPKTSSGKIQHHACKKAFLEKNTNIVEKWSEEAWQQANFQEIEKTVDALLEEVKKRKIAVPAEEASEDKLTETQKMKFSLLYFASNEAEFQDNKYRLLLEGAKFADSHDFHAVWIPERHFHPFGGLYPEPSILGGVLGTLTENIRIRPGSVVLPLQNPVRVAEQWSVVDNLSAGRVDMSFARGWNANDFILAPDNYADRTQVMFEGINTIQKLWRGKAISLPNGKGEETEIKIYPSPNQTELPVWITCSGGKERFIEAGAMGANVLTALLFQPIEDLAEKIKLYREARAQNGHDPDAGCVSLMLHTFVGPDVDFVRDRVRQPFINYLESSIDLWRNESQPLEGLTPEEREKVLDYAFSRYFQTTALFGTPNSCMAMVDKLSAIGVDEIACLIDFGIETDSVLSNLQYLNQLRHKANTPDSEAQQITNSQSIQTDESNCRQIQAVMIQHIAKSLQVDSCNIEPDKSFFALGIDSLKGIELVEELSRIFAIDISPASLFEHPTIAKLSQYLSSLSQLELSYPVNNPPPPTDTNTHKRNWMEVEL
ncbi:MAG: MupA/Atu3671 family FMN-dependent luciferase-like monooxygenase [Cyanobacteria bacterium J06555_13]